VRVKDGETEKGLTAMMTSRSTSSVASPGSKK
jgi:hypothetical protein